MRITYILVTSQNIIDISVVDKHSRNLQVPAVQLHDPLLHLLLVRQQLVHPQEVSVSCIVVVTDLRWGLRSKTSVFQGKSLHFECVYT